tara:strand:- start:796 stop:1302 length:507 start_codon:yes stop_codon:yes gene_type:complete
MREFKKAKIRIFFYVLGMLLLFNCLEEKQIALQDDRRTIITDSSYTKFMIGKQFSLWSPNKENIEKVDSILVKAINDNVFYSLKSKDISEIHKFYRQYLCYIDGKGEKIIFINSMCDLSDYINEYDNSEKNDWKNEMLKIADGGDCYWNIKINLTTNEYFDLRINTEG